MPTKRHRIQPKLREFAVANRLEPTQPERSLWYALRKSRLNGLKFRRQQLIGPYIVDFLCPRAGLIVEVGGESHVGRRDDDRTREEYLRAAGYRVMRVTNDDVLTNLEGVAQAILAAAGFATADNSPTPWPPPSRKGGNQCPR